MKIFKNVLLSVLIGHVFGVLACAFGALWALRLPDCERAIGFLGLAACTVSILAVGISSKKLSSGSVVCALLSGGLYLIIGALVGKFAFETDGIGVSELVVVIQGIVIPLIFCFSGVRFMSRKRRNRRVKVKMYK